MTEKLSAYRRLEPQAAVSAGAGLRRLELPSGGAIYAAAAENEQIASRDRPIAISLPLGRPLGDIVCAQAFAMQPDAKKYRRYIWAVLREVEQPLDVATRVRVFANCHDLSPRTRLDHPSYATSVSFFGSEYANHYAAGDRSTAGVSMYEDLTPTLARLENPAGLRSDRLTVQLLPHCSNSETNVRNIRPRRLEVVIL